MDFNFKKKLKELKNKKLFYSKETKKFMVVPITYYTLLIDPKSKEALNLANRHLSLYPNWKKRLIQSLLFFHMLPKIKVNVENDMDAIFLGFSIKKFNFKNKEIISIKKEPFLNPILSLGPEFITPIKKYDNSIITKEELFSPTSHIDNKDLVHIFKKLILSYKNSLKNKNIKYILKNRKKRLPNENIINIKGNISLLCSNVHGDFWMGNIEKYKNKFFVFDWGRQGTGIILEDFLNYFFTDFIFKNKIKLNEMDIIFNFIKKELDINKKDLSNQIIYGVKLMVQNTSKIHLKKLDKFRNNILKII